VGNNRKAFTLSLDIEGYRLFQEECRKGGVTASDVFNAFIETINEDVEPAPFLKGMVDQALARKPS